MHESKSRNDEGTPMTAERLQRLLSSAMSKYVASRRTEDWLDLAEAHPSAIVKEMATRILQLEQAAKPSERGPTVITDPPGAAVEMFLRKNGRLPNKPGDGLDLLDRLELAAQACRAAHILSCEATCREAAEVIRAANRQKGEV